MVDHRQNLNTRKDLKWWKKILNGPVFEWPDKPRAFEVLKNNGSSIVSRNMGGFSLVGWSSSLHWLILFQYWMKWNVSYK